MNGPYIYDLSTTPIHDKSTESYEYHKFFPTQNSDLNTYSTFRIVINARDQLYHIHEAYIEATGQLVKEVDDTEYGETDGIAFIHNAFPFMFRNFTYKINGQIVDSIDYPGHVSTLFNNVMFSSNKQYESGLQYFWSPDTTSKADASNKGWEIRRKMLLVEPTKKGIFKFKIPIKNIFGFGENVKVITKVNHEFEITRQENYYSLFRGNVVSSENHTALPNVETAEGKIKLKDFVLWIPVVKPEGTTKIHMKESELSSKDEYIIAYRQRKGLMVEVPNAITTWTWGLTTINFKERPQYLFMGFQHNNDIDQKSNYALFKHMDVKNMCVIINDQQFPAMIADADFANLDVGNFYMALQNVRSNYLQMDPYINECGINLIRFKNLTTIFAFDLTKHERDIRGDVVTARLQVNFAKPTPTNLKAYACLINEKEIFLKSDGGNVVIR